MKPAIGSSFSGERRAPSPNVRVQSLAANLKPCASGCTHNDYLHIETFVVLDCDLRCQAEVLAHWPRSRRVTLRRTGSSTCAPRGMSSRAYYLFISSFAGLGSAPLYRPSSPYLRTPVVLPPIPRGRLRQTVDNVEPEIDSATETTGSEDHRITFDKSSVLLNKYFGKCCLRLLAVKMMSRRLFLFQKSSIS